MGRVTAKIKVENMLDHLLFKRGDIPASAVRSTEIEDALVDLQPDPKAQQLIPNPAHGGKLILDLY
jgi:hypothetical protein